MLRRWNSHVWDAKKKSGQGCYRFWDAIRTYGPDAFSHKVLEVCDSLEVANLAEECWIELLETCDPSKGFNISRGGGHRPGQANPWDRPEYREKQKALNTVASMQTAASRRANRDALNTPESKARRVAALKESHARPEVKEKISSNSRAGMTPEARGKISASVSSRKRSPELLARIAASVKESQSSDEHRASQAEKTRAAWQDPEFRARHSASNKSSDPEVRARIAASLRATLAKRKAAGSQV